MDKEYFRIEEYDRDLTCEHRETLDDLSLDPCHDEAEYAVSVPMWSDESRTRYCREHLFEYLQGRLP